MGLCYDSTRFDANAQMEHNSQDGDRGDLSKSQVSFCRHYIELGRYAHELARTRAPSFHAQRELVIVLHEDHFPRKLMA
jgi:hypothetical protein